jgi:protein tyrosine phosphatase (PTP) superfamily phosphohydrolase (DUF442 family)
VSIDQIRNFLAFDNRIGMAGQPTEEQLRDVAAEGYGAVINLGLLDPKYCLADEAALSRSLGMAYRHIPVRFDAPTAEDFDSFVEAMDSWADKRVLVHCAANYRVSAFMALYGELRLGWTREQADGLIRKLWARTTHGPDSWLASGRRSGRKPGQ